MGIGGGEQLLRKKKPPHRHWGKAPCLKKRPEKELREDFPDRQQENPSSDKEISNEIEGGDHEERIGESSTYEKKRI